MDSIDITTYTRPHDQKENSDSNEQRQQSGNQAISEINQMLRSETAEPDKQKIDLNSFTSTIYSQSDEVEKDALFDPMPKIPAGAFPPSLQSAVDAACLGTEAHPMAVALHYVVYFASHIGQQRFIKIGNARHSLDIYGILVGRTGKVKGTAEEQVIHIEKLAITHLEKIAGYVPPRRLSGLSSGEGLIQAIKDQEGEDAEKGVVDKRLMITESEYANVLTQDQRNGNTLSMVLRDAYDGKQLSNITLSPRVASSPHINIIGHITPGEFTEHKSFHAQAVNGALNRNLIFFAGRNPHAPIPRAYSQEEKSALSQWFAESVIRARDNITADDYQCKHAGKQIIMSDEAMVVIFEEYFPRETAQDAMPEMLANLVSRHRVFVWRLSAIFALMDNTDTIQPENVRQAYRWLDYSAASIRYLLKTAVAEAKQKDVVSMADKIYDFLLTFNNAKGATTTEINRKLFSGNKKSKEISQALQVLAESTPPKIEQFESQRQGRGRKKTTFVPIKTK